MTYHPTFVPQRLRFASGPNNTGKGGDDESDNDDDNEDRPLALVVKSASQHEGNFVWEFFSAAKQRMSMDTFLVSQEESKEARGVS